MPGRSWSAAPRSARPSPGRAREFGVLRRAVAVGGQVLTLQGLGGVYEEVFLPLHGAHQAQNAAVALAAVEAFLGAGAGAAARRRDGPGGLRRGQLARAGWSGSAPRRRSCSTPRTTRTAWPPRSPRCRRSSRSAGWSRWSRVLADKDAAGLLELLEPVLDAHRGAPATARPGRCRPTSWPSWRRGGLRAGPGARSAEDMPDAIEAAVPLAESDVAGRAGRGRRADHRVGGDRRRRPPAAEAMTGPAAERRTRRRPDPTPRRVRVAVGEPGRTDRRRAAHAGTAVRKGRSRRPGLGGLGRAQRRSGLRNPEGAVRGLGAGDARPGGAGAAARDPADPGGRRGAERRRHRGDRGAGRGCVVLAGMMGRRWAWHAGTVLQGLLMSPGLLHWSLLVLGVSSPWCGRTRCTSAGSSSADGPGVDRARLGLVRRRRGPATG